MQMGSEGEQEQENVRTECGQGGRTAGPLSIYVLQREFHTPHQIVTPAAAGMYPGRLHELDGLSVGSDVEG